MYLKKMAQEGWGELENFPITWCQRPLLLYKHQIKASGIHFENASSFTVSVSNDRCELQI